MGNNMIGILQELGIKYGTDKVEHGYLPIYDEHISKISCVENILEIGIWQGQSLNMWADYLPNATIHGLDIIPCSIFFDKPNIKIYAGNQTDVNLLKLIVEKIQPLSIVIDDGSHMMGDAMISFKTLFPYLKTGGIYAIEDLHTCYDVKYRNKGSRNTMDFLFNMVNIMNTSTNTDIKSIEFYKSLCIITKK